MWPLRIMYTKSQLLSSVWMWDMVCVGQTQKIRKNAQKTIFSGLWGAEMGLKSWNCQTGHVGLLLNEIVKFQSFNSICRWDVHGAGFFQC